eukprot:2864590-Rhodomonas_salina.1
MGSKARAVSQQSKGGARERERGREGDRHRHRARETKPETKTERERGRAPGCPVRGARGLPGPTCGACWPPRCT